MEELRDTLETTAKRLGLLNKNCCSIGPFDIGSSQSIILSEIAKRNSPSMQEIADTLATDITTFSRQIQTLIKMGFVQKNQSSQDRRVYTLSLTTEGKFAIGTIHSQMEQYLEEVFSHMNEFERETVKRSLQVLNAAMAKSSVCCKPLF
ncbi:MarR family winged helix-turn-helix transcriptional regulator [Peribacillus alkalitolerans]|uniref:MarR family winged helix-turn-helix transcriptional regulator n=1 Tax=Peribacillus alkalitolerans TaxID=1550385 RepID=UPI0013D3F236|nr:MarR family winged helix-turn-helix transcriptional regulator [Peribacillus alkalitolerans]